MDFSQIQDKISALGGVGTVAAVFAAAAVLGVVLAGVVMWIGASMAGIEGATLARSMLAAIMSGILSSIGSVVGSAIPDVGAGVGLALGVIGSAFGIKMVYKTTFVKAVLGSLCVVLVLLAISLISYSVLRAWGSINGIGP